MRRHRDEDAHGRYPGKKQRRRIASDDDNDENEDEGIGLDSDDDDEEEEEEEQGQENHGVRRPRAPATPSLQPLRQPIHQWLT